MAPPRPGVAALLVLTALAAASPAAEPLHVHWMGAFYVHHSYAVVNRYLVSTLMGNRTLSITPIATKPADFTPKGKSFQALSKAIVNLHVNIEHQPRIHSPDVTVSHEWPPRLDWQGPMTGKWVIIQPWEYCSLPQKWTRTMVDGVDEIWVPSEYVRRCYGDSGVPISKVFVVPNGIDPVRFSPSATPYPLRTQKSFKFLYLGGTIYRKGIGILLEAFHRAFSSAHDVALVVKDTARKRFYKKQGAEETIERIQSEPGAAEIEYLPDDIDDDDLPGIYAACDCLVSPYYAEGFGLPILEAMAVGLPVIVTGKGPAVEFVTERTGYLIDAQVVSTGSNEIANQKDMRTVGDILLTAPDENHLQDLLWHVSTHQDEARAKGQRASHHARSRYAWKRVAQVAADRLANVAQKGG